MQVFSTDVNAHVQYKSKRSVYLFLAHYNFLKASNQTFSNNLFYHLRYNYKLNDWLRWEVFTQLQQNKITGIDFRVLAGTGPRFKIHHSKIQDITSLTFLADLLLPSCCFLANGLLNCATCLQEGSRKVIRIQQGGNTQKAFSTGTKI